jgi:pyruvate formate-lyase activating enzyme-like uncharacterized protein
MGLAETNEDRRRAVREMARQLYGEAYDLLRFPTAAQADAASRERDAILARIGGHSSSRCWGTKLHSGVLSPGCQTCVAGAWSCLFVNERCNARCFYCPAPQDGTGVPMTNGVPFPRAGEYLEYLARFGFRGVSISGGEPLLTLERTLRFIRAVKGRFGAEIHLWLYTNGVLLDRETVKQLRAAGLDEIRFNIGAVGYRLDRVRLAVGAFEHVTVEIPAIPEDRERLEQGIAEMARIGVRHLNLHQLRLTPHNLPKLLERGYTFVHGDNVTVLESELTALRLMQHSIDHGIDLPIHYCSYVYKDRFQRAFARRRCAALALRGHEAVTPSGFIRALGLRGHAEEIAALKRRLRQQGAPPGAWTAGTDRLAFAPELWPIVCRGPTSVTVAYAAPRILPSVTYRNPFIAIPLGRRRTIVVERVPAGPDRLLGPGDAEALRRVLLEGTAPDVERAGEALREALGYEQIAPGLQDYY